MQRRRLLLPLAALLLSCLAFFGFQVLFPPPIVQAHAYVIGSDPVDGSTINSIPKTIRIFFNAPLSSASSARLYTIQNNQQLEVPITSTIPANDQKQLTLLPKTPSSLSQGSYEILWTGVANADGHTTYGVIGFNVGQSSLGLSGQTILGPSSSNRVDDIRSLDFYGLLAVAWQWFALLALTLWIGILVCEYLIIDRNRRIEALTTKIKKQVISLQRFCLSILLLSEGVLLFLHVSNLSRVQLRQGFAFSSLYQILVNTGYGWLWLLRLVLLLVGLFLLYKGSRDKGILVVPEKTPRPEQRNSSLRTVELPELHTTATASLTKERIEVKRTTSTTHPVRTYPLACLLLAGGIMLTYALSSETVQTIQTPLSAVCFEWLRLAAQGIWLGSLIYLGYLLLPGLPGIGREPHAETSTYILQRFTPFLAGSIGVYLVCTLFLDEVSLETTGQLFSDPYGRTLLIQALLIVGLSSLSLLVLFWLRPRMMRQSLLLPVVNAELPAKRSRQTALSQTEQKIKQILRFCALPGAAILLCSALMAFYAPPIKFPHISYTQPAVTSGTTPSNPVQTKQAGDLSISLQVLPARADAENVVVVTLNDKQGKGVSNAKVQLIANMQIMDMGTAFKTIEPGKATYRATFDRGEAFTMSGIWLIQVKIQQPGQSEVTTTFQMPIS